MKPGALWADSLAMAQFGVEQTATTLMVAGARFMGESAKTLSPTKGCSCRRWKLPIRLDLGCPIETFSQFCDENTDRIVVVYCNISAAAKARAE